MSLWRLVVVGVLLAAPLLVMAGFGTYYLWQNNLSFIVWWPMMGLMFAGYFLAWHWQRQRSLLHPPAIEPEPYFTERDKQAVALVDAKAKAVLKDHADKLTSQEIYISTAKELAIELAQFYHPGSADAVDRLTIPEMLAAVELAAEDMAVLVEKYFPGGHLLTVRDFKRAASLASYVQHGSNIYWGVMAFFDPIGTGLKYAASKAGGDLPMRMLQRHLIGWFFEAYVTRLGKYLIEVNSGRLRVGARRYRQLREQMRMTTEVAPDPADEVTGVSVTLIGQVKAGKSSLVNALLGEDRARTSSVPCTEGMHRYDVTSPGVPTKLVVWDSEGYGNEGPRADGLATTFEAAKGSDVVLLVLHAKNPGRQADVIMLQKMEAWFAARPELKPPPVIAVTTHIDLLSPMMEWSPPYDWKKGSRPKEKNIREALEVVREQLGEHLDGVVPVCTGAGRVYGVDQDLVPALTQVLNEARGVAFLRALKAEADRDRIRRTFQQAWELGKETAGTVWGMLGKALKRK